MNATRKLTARLLELPGTALTHAGGPDCASAHDRRFALNGRPA